MIGKQLLPCDAEVPQTASAMLNSFDALQKWGPFPIVVEVDPSRGAGDLLISQWCFPSFSNYVPAHC